MGLAALKSPSLGPLGRALFFTFPGSYRPLPLSSEPQGQSPGLPTSHCFGHSPTPQLCLTTGSRRGPLRKGSHSQTGPTGDALPIQRSSNHICNVPFGCARYLSTGSKDSGKDISHRPLFCPPYHVCTND